MVEDDRLPVTNTAHLLKALIGLDDIGRFRIILVNLCEQ